MNVAIVRPTDPLDDRVDVCIVVDVLRATSTAVVLCDRMNELCVVRTVADLGELPPRPGGYALFSELSSVASAHLRFDNSPTQARDAALGDRMPVLVTTNGTLAVGLAAQLAGEVVLASFVNLSAVADYVRGLGVAAVAVMPAGNIGKGERCIEDDGCADTLAARLSALPCDVAATVAACHADARIIRRRTNEPNLAADIDLCFAIDALPTVPHVVHDVDNRWFRVAPATRRRT